MTASTIATPYHAPVAQLDRVSASEAEGREFESRRAHHERRVQTMRPYDKETILTERLLLRPLRETDALELFSIHSDPRVMRYWSTPPWESIEAAHENIARDLKAMAAGEYVQFGIERREDARLAGKCTLFNLAPKCKRAEIGYGLSSTHWGRGYAHEALSALVRFGFQELDLNRIEADVDPRNLRSLKLLERLGFTKEGQLRERWIVGGEVSDSAIFGLLRRDFVERSKRTPSCACNP